MELGFFESVIEQVKPYTKEIACHVMGDPLTLSNLSCYLDIIAKHGLKALLTTSGYFLKKHSYETLFHPAVKQINISLNSFNKNNTALRFEQYMEPIVALCQEKLRHGREGVFINLRLWNFDEQRSESAFNHRLFRYLGGVFGESMDIEKLLQNYPKSLRLAPKILMHFDYYFEWPSLDNAFYGDGSCQGLQSHIAILASGRVVPCCLDGEGVMALGSLHDTPLHTILTTPRTTAIIEGFQCGKAIEPLCQHCSYKERFNPQSREKEACKRS